MNELVIESVIMAFAIGGIIGAAAALSLKTSRLWDSRKDTLELKPIPIKQSRRRHGNNT